MNWEDSDFAQFALEKVGNATEYALAWSIYAVCIFVLLLVFMGWTRWIKWVFPKNILRFAIVGVVAVPIAHPAEPQFLIPAIVVATVGYFLEGYEYAAPSIRMLGLGAIGGVLVGCLMALLEIGLLKLWRSIFPPKPSPDNAEADADNRLDDDGGAQASNSEAAPTNEPNNDDAGADMHNGPIKPSLPGATT